MFGFLGTLVGKRKQTILKKRWFDIASSEPLLKREAILLYTKKRGLLRVWVYSMNKTGVGGKCL
jgi:hypothetical protein